MTPDIKAVQHQVARHRPVDRNLQGVIRGSLVRYKKDVLAQNAWVVGSPRIDAGLRCGGSGRIRSVVVVDHDGQVMRQRSDIGSGQADLAGQLTLNGGIDLVDQGPLRVF